jgi:predicted nucleic acid-binding protein
MADVFADTSGIANLVDRSEEFHEQAKELYDTLRSQSRSFVTTNYILAELIATLTRPLRTPRERVVEIVRNLKSSSSFQVLHVDEETDEDAFCLLSRRQDKEWSLVDCASFVLMERLGLTEALTTDHHFEQAGFTRLLK